MRKNKLFLLLALLLTAATGAWAQTWDSGDCTVTLSDDVMTVSGTGAMANYADSYALPWYGNYIKTIVIESGVTSIGNSAFAKCYNLESVSIPASVTSIGIQAFENCGSDVEAMTVSFAEGSTPLTIGEGAFGYANLKSIDIPNRVTSIGNGAFTSCSKLESVSIPASVTSIGNFAFQSCGSYAEALTVSFAEGSTLESIGESTFLEAKLTSINIPNSVTSIGTFAFSGCSNLESVSIPASVTSIGYNAFSSCSKLESVSIPASVTSISEGAFRYCGMLAKVYIFAPSLTTYGANAFSSNATGRKIYVLPDAVDTYKAGWSAYAADIEAMTLTLYATSLKDGTVDAKNWTIASGEKSATGDAADGLTGLSEGQTVTLTYTGRLKVKGVKATSDAAAASVPDGAISGVFSVSDSKKVYFSKGNLRYASSKWSFFDNQYDFYTSYSADAWDHFGWSTSATDYGKNTSTTNSDYSGDFVDWGATMGAGWFTLSSDEWTYLLKTRSASTVGGTENGRCAKAKVNNVRGVILFPDTYTHPDGVNAPTGVNATDATGWNGNSYTAADWTKMESAGCVFLPAAGYRSGSSVSNAGSVGDYSSATPSNAEKAYELYFSSGSLNTASEGSRRYGLSVRLVSEVATSDEEQAGPTYTLLSAATTADCGKVVCAAGHLHDAKTAVPDGCTAVGILGKVTETGHGLILALKNATNQNWNTINGWASASYAGTTLKVLPDDAARGTNLTSYTALGETAVSNWAVAQKSDYEAIFTNLGSTRNSGGMTYDNNVNAYITTGVGGTAMSGTYWSATQDDDYDAWYFLASYWDNDYKTYTYYVRPVLGF